MLSRFLISCLSFSLFASAARAENAPLPQSLPTKPAAVIYFDHGTAIDSEHDTMVHNMARQAKLNSGMDVREYVLNSESQLAEQIEQIADTDTGFIVIVEPHDTEALARLPSLYPDIRFTIIGVERPLYLPNVSTMQFRESEGAFIMGALAALHTKSHTIAFISKDDNAATRSFAYAFLQGSKYINSDVQILEQLGPTLTRRTATTAIRSQSPKEIDADIIFVLDEDLLEKELRHARAQKQLVISYNHDMTRGNPDVVLTSLLKHYDLAVFAALQSHYLRSWKNKNDLLGVHKGYIDYVLNAENKATMPKEMIDRIETIKDFITQGVIEIRPLGP